MKPLIAFVLVAVSAPMPAWQQQPPQVQRERVMVPPNSAPQEFTVDCPAGRRVLSGGFDAVPAVRVTGSRPLIDTAEGRESWSVWVLNPAKVAQPVELIVLCGEADTVAVSAPGTSARCPNATVPVGGGFVSQWLPSQGGAAITGSYPVPGAGWGIDIAQLPPPAGAAAGFEVRTFAVCGRGLAPPAYQIKVFEIPTGAVGCSENLTGGGFQLIGARPPGFLVTAAMPTGREWRVTAEGRSDTNRALAMRLTAICVATTAAPDGSPMLAEPVAEARDLLPVLVAGVGAVVAALLVLIVLLSTRSRSRRRSRPQARVTVVLRARHSAFRMDELREVR